MIRFKIGGRPVSPGNMADALQQAMLEQVEQNLRERIGSIRHPETGEFPTIMVSGDSPLPSRGRRLRVAIELLQRTFISMPSITFGL
jgi:hypothetical protein